MLILPRSAIGTLTARGHQAELARDVGLGAAPDVQIAAHVRQTGEALLTRDLDFADVRHYPPKDYGGIVVLRVPDHSTAASGGALDTKSSVVVPFPTTDLSTVRLNRIPSCCGKGHPLTPDNLRIDEGEQRWRCLECGRERASACRRRNGAAG
jgi:predicted nuclease of predicted toxin-antitoxin system